MKFTYEAYKALLALLKKDGYAFRNYHNYGDTSRCVILRHDIDFSLESAVRLAEAERKAGVSSTYFVLLRTDFYNPASRRGTAALRRIQSLGHEIGLHFDERAYLPELLPDQLARAVIEESGILSALLGTPVSTVSMHRPSRSTLEGELLIPGIVNSYGKIFFRDFKYLSDSRRRWREPVLDIVRSGEYERLHILTHAFWYHEEEEDLSRTAGDFIRSANRERYRRMAENITDIESIFPKSEVFK